MMPMFHTLVIPPCRPSGHIITYLLALTPGTRIGVYEVTPGVAKAACGPGVSATDHQTATSEAAIKILIVFYAGRRPGGDNLI